MYKLSGTYKPNSKLQLDYDVLGKQSKQDENTNTVLAALTGNTRMAALPPPPLAYTEAP